MQSTKGAHKAVETYRPVDSPNLSYLFSSDLSYTAQPTLKQQFDAAPMLENVEIAKSYLVVTGALQNGY